MRLIQASPHPPSILDRSHVRMLDVHCVWSPQSPHPGHCFIRLRMPDSGSFSKSLLILICPGQGPEVPKPSGGQDGLCCSEHHQCLSSTKHPVQGAGGGRRRDGLSWQKRLTRRPVMLALCPGAAHIYHCTQARDTLLHPLPLFKVPGPSSWFPHPRHTPIPKLACGFPAPPGIQDCGIQMSPVQLGAR